MYDNDWGNNDAIGWHRCPLYGQSVGSDPRVLSAGSIDRGAVVDAVHDHDTVLVEDLLHDPVSAAASGVQTVQLPLKQRADTVGIFDQCAEHELYDRRGSALREAGQLPLGGPRNLKLIGRRVLAHRFRYRLRSSSAVTTSPAA